MIDLGSDTLEHRHFAGTLCLHGRWNVAVQITSAHMKIILIILGSLLGAALLGFLALVVLARARRNRQGSSAEAAAQPMTAAEFAEFVSRIPGHAEKHREMAKGIFDTDLDYSAESIAKLDQIVRDGWPKEPPAMLEPVVLGFGSYLGETMRHLHGGDWCYNEDLGVHLDLAGKDIKVFPFNKVRKRFLNGEEDSLEFFYKVIRSELEKLETGGTV
ncbi:MAG: hypothetical protein JWM16_2137 [Verrucomicrobiales bacterium]|nr:hypothetical protein [Verrucomicrobiales bacterium]